MPFQKQDRVDLARAIDALRLILLDDERACFLNSSERAAIKDAQAVMQSKLALDAGRELAKLARTG